MPKHWERELRRLNDVPAPTERILARSDRPTGPQSRSPMPSTRQRVVAGVVAFGVFIAAAAFGWQAFTGGRSPAQPAITDDWPVATVTLSSVDSAKSAVLSIGGRSQEGVFGSSTSPDEEYPYRWSNPPIDRAIAVPIGAELRLEGDVQIEEILFGDAAELDAGRGPDSGPISSEQPTFEEPYFPVQDQPRREYWKLFGTWADGSVLDVYFEVRWVEPRVDLSDTSVDIVVAPETLDADLLYGGQRRGTMGEGSYGDMNVTTDRGGYDADTLYFPVAAGSTINVVGEDLESWTARVARRQGPEQSGPIDQLPDTLGPTMLRLSVVWGNGTGSFRFPIEIAEPQATADDVTEVAPVPILGWVPPRSFEGETLDGRTLDPRDYRRGATIAVAWATWCEPCRGTLTEVQEWTDVSRLGPRAVGIVERSDADRARRMVRELELAFPTVIAGADLDGWGIEAVPSVWVMASDGTVVAHRAGSVDRDWLADAVYEATFSETSPETAPGGVRIRLSEGLHGATLEYEGVEQVGITSESFVVVDMYDGHPLPDVSVDDFPYLIQVPPRTAFQVSLPADLEGYTWSPQRPVDSEGGQVIPGRLGPQVFFLRIGMKDDTEYDVAFGLDVVETPSEYGLTLDDVLGCWPQVAFHFSARGVKRSAGASYITANLEGVGPGDRIVPMDGGAGESWGPWLIVRDGVTTAWVDYRSLSGVACEGSGIGGV
jgi:hypothetical protein